MPKIRLLLPASCWFSPLCVQFCIHIHLFWSPSLHCWFYFQCTCYLASRASQDAQWFFLTAWHMLCNTGMPGISPQAKIIRPSEDAIQKYCYKGRCQFVLCISISRARLGRAGEEVTKTTVCISREPAWEQLARNLPKRTDLSCTYFLIFF